MAFSPLDWSVLAAYLAGTTFLGIRLGRSQKSSHDYFIGDRSLPAWAILLSVVATETSALTFISVPGLAYLGNFTFLQIVLGYIIGRAVVAWILLPRYFQGELVTAYALLEKRFGLPTRRFASITFLVTRAFGDSVRMFATAIPVSLVLGEFLPGPWVMHGSIVILGALTLVYTYHGGMRAVVWTDVLQTFVYLAGGIAAIVLLGRAGGAGAAAGWHSILSEAGARGKLQVLDFHLGFDRPFTLFSGLIGGAFLSMSSHGVDQLLVQRLLSAKDLRDSRLALVGSGFVVLFQMTLFLMIGIGLYHYYAGAAFPAPDSIFPKFIIEAMPIGMKGLVIAAILAATMSTHSGAINSLAAATVYDLYLPLARKKHRDGKALLRVSRMLTLVWGIGLTAGALLYRDEKTPVVTVALSVASFTYGGLLGGFFLGILSKAATQRDALFGMSLGIATMVFVVFGKQLGHPALGAIAWPWHILIGSSVTLAAGLASAALFSALRALQGAEVRRLHS